MYPRSRKVSTWARTVRVGYIQASDAMTNAMMVIEITPRSTTR
jgi:hypothetical protein